MPPMEPCTRCGRDIIVPHPGAKMLCVDCQESVETLHKKRTIAMLQIIKEGGTISFEQIVEGFKKHGVDVKTGAHLKTLMTPLTDLGIVAHSRSGKENWYWLTGTGENVLAQVL